MSRYETPATRAEAVDDFRAAQAAIRQIRRNGGRTAATTNALERHEKIAARAMRYLLDQREMFLAGWLESEAGLIARIADSAMERPELQARLVLTRRNIRRRLQHIEAANLAATKGE